MNPPVIAFFNGKRGVGTTTLVYHLAWAFADMGAGVVVADLDPQSSLTVAFLGPERLGELWDRDDPPTLLRSVERLMASGRDVCRGPAVLADETVPVMILAGDVGLWRLGKKLASAWDKCLSGDEMAFRLTRAFWCIVHGVSRETNASVVLMDLGPNLGAINRAGLLAADQVLIPLSPDPFSLHWLDYLGREMAEWRGQWQERLRKGEPSGVDLPPGRIEPMGYVMLGHSLRLDATAEGRQRWTDHMPREYHRRVLREAREAGLTIGNDPECVGVLRDYRSLMPMALEARKPVFHLSPADGAIGAHARAVRSAYQDFHSLASEIARRAGVELA